MCYNDIDKGKQKCELEQILKEYRSTDCRLQLVYMKMESLVIVDQHATVNMFPGLVHTARHVRGVSLVGRILLFLFLTRSQKK